MAVGWSCVVCGRILPRLLGEMWGGWGWLGVGWWFMVEVFGDVEMLGWIVKICVVKNLKTRWSMCHSTSHLYIHPPLKKTKMISWKITIFLIGDTSTPNGCLSVVMFGFPGWPVNRMSRTPFRPNWLPSNPCRLGYIADQVFFGSSLGILRVSMQNMTKNHTKVSHSSVISKNVTSSFQWESSRTGLLPASICFSKQMMLPEPPEYQNCWDQDSTSSCSTWIRLW